MEGSYHLSQQNGFWTFWHANGIRSSYGAYLNGKKVGTWIVLKETGEIDQQASGRFVDGNCNPLE